MKVGGQAYQMLQDRPLDVKIKAPVRQLIPCFLFKRKLCHQPLLIHIEYLHVTFFFFLLLDQVKITVLSKNPLASTLQTFHRKLEYEKHFSFTWPVWIWSHSHWNEQGRKYTLRPLNLNFSTLTGLTVHNRDWKS